MPIRRNLSASLPPQSPQTVAKTTALEEDVFPLQCTPEPRPKPSSMDPNMTFDIMDGDCQAEGNATIILSGEDGASEPSEGPGPSQPLRPHKATDGSQASLKR